MTSPKSKIDREQLRALLRGMRRYDHLALLDCAVEALTDDALVRVFGSRVDVRALARASDASPAGVLAAVRAFHKASLAGAHYDDFDVNSRNSMETSPGTEAWIAECERLVKRCVEAEGAGGARVAESVGEAFRLLFDLLRRIDVGEEIVFFADEGGSWQVGVRWDRVLPSYFRCLAASAPPRAYAEEVVALIEHFASQDAKKLLGRARTAATPEQRAALSSTRAPRGR